MSVSDRSDWLVGGGVVGEYIRSLDWTSLAFGPRESWASVLRVAVNVMIESRFPMALLWGPESLLLYNDGFRIIAGEKHPYALGRSLREIWPEGSPIFPTNVSHGQAIYLENKLLPIKKHGYQKSAFFDLSYSPVRDESGLSAGSLISLHETSRPAIAKGEARDVQVIGPQEAKEQKLAHLRFLESMDYINGVISGTLDVDKMMSDMLDATLSIFECDRAFLLYPCDPNATTWRVPIERNRPQYPGVLVQGLDMPMDRDVAQTFRVLLASDGPVKFGPGTMNPLPPDVSERFGFKSFMSMAVFTKVGQPWQFGLHQCSYARVWTAEEERLFEAIGRRLADGLTTLLAYRQLEDTQVKLQEAQRIAHLGYWDGDLEANTIELADEVYRILGLQPAESILDLEQWFERGLQLVHPEDRFKVAQAWDKASLGSLSNKVEYRLSKTNGEIRHIYSETKMVYKLGARHVVGIIQDITERYETQYALRQANKQLVEADHRKNEFLAVLSHELRNPLSPIRNSIHLLQAAPNLDKAQKALRIIDRQTKHMARLIEDLLDVTRISRGKLILQRERVNLNTLAQMVAEDFREVFSKSGIDFQVTGTAEPLWAHVDHTRIAQAIGNLLGNSAKFTQSAGKVVLSVESSEQGTAYVRVIDNGAGISPAVVSHLFEPFAQSSPAKGSNRGGLGLGLFLVKEIVEMHGGSVMAHSNGEGCGSEFAIVLPLYSLAQSNSQIPSLVTRLKNRRVLVIEDNVDAADSLRELLELGNHQVRVAYFGIEGVSTARVYKPDIIICDIGLPDIDGYSVARELRGDSDASLHSVFMVALSGYASQEDVVKSREAGFDRHMAKPLSIEALEKILAKAP